MVGTMGFACRSSEGDDWGGSMCHAHGGRLVRSFRASMAALRFFPAVRRYMRSAPERTFAVELRRAIARQRIGIIVGEPKATALSAKAACVADLFRLPLEIVVFVHPEPTQPTYE